MVCRECGATTLRREDRRGFLQLKIFPLFGLYPWECVMCRKVRIYRRHLAEKLTRLPLRGSGCDGGLDSAPQPLSSEFNGYRKPTR
jgi:hypothetical protein